MTRKHFEAIAAIVKRQYVDARSMSLTILRSTPSDEDGECPAAKYDIGRMNAAKQLAYDLSDYFAAEDPRFDRARFLAACGVKA